jgi:hypothetical protein
MEIFQNDHRFFPNNTVKSIFISFRNSKRTNDSKRNTLTKKDLNEYNMIMILVIILYSKMNHNTLLYRNDNICGYENSYGFLY